MNIPSLTQHLRRHGLTVAAVFVGVLLGRNLRHAVSPDVAPAPKPVSEVAATPQEPQSLRSSEGADASVEAEVARLLGGATSENNSRTPQQAIDAISTAFQEKSDLRRFLAIYEAVSELGKDDLAEALGRARTENNAIAIRALERRWAEVDPVGAAKAWAEGKTQPLGDAFFSAWAKSNPASALRWFSGLEDGDIKNQSRALILNQVAKSDPQRALDFANQLPEGKDQSQLITQALATLGAKDPNEALAAAQRLPEGASRKAGLDAVVTQIAGSNLAEAQKLMAELPPNTLSNAGATIAAALVKQSPDKALEWAATLPDGQSKESAFGGIAREWASRDVAAAATWLDTLAAGSARNSAVASFANRTAPRDPEGATIWASTLPSGAQRTSVLSQTISIWQRTNPAAATEWVTNSPGLSAEERATLSQVQSQRPDPQRFQQLRRQRAGN